MKFHDFYETFMIFMIFAKNLRNHETLKISAKRDPFSRPCTKPYEFKAIFNEIFIIFRPDALFAPKTRILLNFHFFHLKTDFGGQNPKKG